MHSINPEVFSQDLILKKKKDVCGKQNLRKINLGDTQTIPDKFRPTTILFITTSCWKTIMHKFLSTNNSID